MPNDVKTTDPNALRIQATGASVSLKNGGGVFVGYADEKPDLTFLMFTNSEGSPTRLILSNEAVIALRNMLNDPPHRRGQYEWRVVMEDQTHAE